MIAYLVTVMSIRMSDPHHPSEEAIKKARSRGYFWHEGIASDGSECRTLIKDGGANDYLHFVPSDLLVYQIEPLPEFI